MLFYNFCNTLYYLCIDTVINPNGTNLVSMHSCQIIQTRQNQFRREEYSTKSGTVQCSFKGRLRVVTPRANFGLVCAHSLSL